MNKKYTNGFHSKALQNLPKLVFLALKLYHLATLNAVQIQCTYAFKPRPSLIAPSDLKSYGPSRKRFGVTGAEDRQHRRSAFLIENVRVETALISFQWTADEVQNC
jgi:hypothetical protein